MYTPRLRKQYDEEILPKLMESFGYTSVMQAPRLQRITVNMGIGEAVQNPKLIDSALQEMTLITGQKPVICRARRSIATYKLREGMPIGVSVTLRRAHAYDFLDRLINVALPRVRDFRGISPKSFDGRGNYTIGIKEQIIFPEISYDNIDKIKGLNVNIGTTARTDDEAKQLLDHFGMPFRK
jgi:large subunit ribosomal protein L5